MNKAQKEMRKNSNSYIGVIQFGMENKGKRKTILLYYLQSTDKSLR